MRDRILEILEGIRDDVDFENEDALVSDNILESFDDVIVRDHIAPFVHDDPGSHPGHALLLRLFGELALIGVIPDFGDIEFLFTPDTDHRRGGFVVGPGKRVLLAGERFFSRNGNRHEKSAQHEKGRPPNRAELLAIETALPRKRNREESLHG